MKINYEDLKKEIIRYVEVELSEDFDDSRDADIIKKIIFRHIFDSNFLRYEDHLLNVVTSEYEKFNDFLSTLGLIVRKDESIYIILRKKIRKMLVNDVCKYFNIEIDDEK